MLWIRRWRCLVAAGVAWVVAPAALFRMEQIPKPLQFAPRVRPEDAVVRDPADRLSRLNAEWFAAARASVAWGRAQGLLTSPKEEMEELMLSKASQRATFGMS